MNARRVLAVAVAVVGGLLLVASQQVRAQEQSASPTVIPVIFTHSIDASKAKVGDIVTAKTLQAVKLPDGTEVAKGSTITGHVTVARPFKFDSTDYAVQQPSILAIHFDRLTIKGGSPSNTNLSVRAMASRLSSQDAMTPHRLDETDAVGTMVQVGGDSYSPLAKPVVSPDDDIVGYNRHSGVYARLLSAEYTGRFSHFACDANSTEQAVSIFSASACGLYGFADVYMTDDGRGNEPGTFRLESPRHTVKLYGQSTALLQTMDGR
jgi:hypothetical protein